MAVENFLARERDLHRPPRDHRELGDDDLVVEGIALAAEAAAVRRGDDAYVRGRKAEGFSERAVDVVRRLRGRPERELVVGVEVSDRRVLLHRQVRVALVEENILADVIGLLETFFQVAELKVHFLVHVRAVAVVVHARIVDHDGLFDARDRLKSFVLDFDQVHRLERRVFVYGRDGGHGVAYEANLADAERVLVLTDRQDAVRDRQIFAGDDGVNAGQGERLRRVDLFNERVRLVGAQDFAVEHTRQSDVVREQCLPRALRARVHLAERLADDFEVFADAVRVVAVAVTHLLT